jgi:hypothetical protein
VRIAYSSHRLPNARRSIASSRGMRTYVPTAMTTRVTSSHSASAHAYDAHHGPPASPCARAPSSSTARAHEPGANVASVPP